MAYVTSRAHIEAARIASQTPEMDALESRVLNAVRASALRHRDTGNYLSKIGAETFVTKEGVHDRIIYADDENADLIEFGGVVEDTGRIIPGLHIMRNALDSVS
jgi:hypothetical protein